MTQRKEPQRTDQRKQSLYFRGELLSELRAQAKRLDRTLSWVVARACVIALDEIRRMPAP